MNFFFFLQYEFFFLGGGIIHPMTSHNKHKASVALILQTRMRIKESIHVLNTPSSPPLPMKASPLNLKQLDSTLTLPTLHPRSDCYDTFHCKAHKTSYSEYILTLLCLIFYHLAFFLGFLPLKSLSALAALFSGVDKMWAL